MGHGFDRHDNLGLGFLSLVEALDLSVVSNREVGRLDKRPGQILVAVFSIAAAFFLAVADLFAAHTAAVRGIVPHTGKSPDLAGLQHDRQS